MVHVNIELWYKEISSQEKACLLSIYWPNCLQKHVWGFMSASLVGAKYIYCLAKLAQNGESNVLTCNRALGGDSKTSWALSSPSRPTSVQAVGGGGVDNHLLEFFFIFLNWQASQIVAKQHLTPYLLSQDWSVQRHLHKEVYTISNMELIAWRIYLQNWHENSHWTLTCRLFRFDSSKSNLSSIQEERFEGKRTVVYIVYTLPQESLPWNS